MVTAIKTGPDQSWTLAVAANVRAETARRGLTQRQLAAHLGVSHTWVNQRWFGRRPWQLSDLEQVAAIFRCDPVELVLWAPWDSNPQPTDYGHQDGAPAPVVQLAGRRRPAHDSATEGNGPATIHRIHSAAAVVV